MNDGIHDRRAPPDSKSQRLIRTLRARGVFLAKVDGFVLRARNVDFGKGWKGAIEDMMESTSDALLQVTSPLFPRKKSHSRTGGPGR